MLPKYPAGIAEITHLPILPILPAEIAGPYCWLRVPRMQGLQLFSTLPRLLAVIAEDGAIAEIADNAVFADTAEIALQNAESAKVARIAEVADCAQIAGRTAKIAGTAQVNKVAEIAVFDNTVKIAGGDYRDYRNCSGCQDCRDYLVLLYAEIIILPTRIAEITEVVANA